MDGLEIWGRHTWIIIFSIFKRYKDIEHIKKLLFIICDNLPCSICKQHALDNINNNNIMSETDINRIYSFFIQLYNKFHLNKIKLSNVNKIQIH